MRFLTFGFGKPARLGFPIKIRQIHYPSHRIWKGIYHHMSVRYPHHPLALLISRDHGHEAPVVCATRRFCSIIDNSVGEESLALNVVWIISDLYHSDITIRHVSCLQDVIDLYPTIGWN